MVSVIIVNACVSFNSFQSPKVVKDNPRGGLGMSPNFELTEKEDTERFYNLELLYRAPLFKNADFGSRIGFLSQEKEFEYIFDIFPFLYYYADVKYQFFNGPVSISPVLGLLISPTSFNIDPPPFTLYPSILIGNDLFYLGLKNVWFINNKINFSKKYDKVFLWGIGIGSMFGKNIKINPELNIINVQDLKNAIYTVGISIQMDFIEKQDVEP
ncbi:MAG: hypothetical protein HQK83_18935 [Fibrobacteria bacterium]|nr:hypothetical protein [Fibrobacteria bacterium]